MSGDFNHKFQGVKIISLTCERELVNEGVVSAILPL